MFRKLICTSITVAVTFGVSMHALADTTPEDAADYRSAVMTSLRGHLIAASMAVRGLVDDNGHLVDHARGIASGVAEIGHLFPAGSNVGDSEALPVIWEDPDGFAAALANAKAATAAFVTAAEGGDQEAIGAAFRNVADGCRGCHDKYRVAEE